MSNDERTIEELRTLRKIEWSKSETDLVWKRLEEQIRGASGNEDSSDSDTFIHHPQFRENSMSQRQPAARLTATNQNSISMGGESSKPNRDGRT